MRYINPQIFLNRVCDFYGISETQLMEKKKDCYKVVRARHALAYLLRMHCHMTLNEVGKFIGGRNHSTVIHSMTQINDYSNPGILSEIEYLSKGERGLV